MKTKRIFEKAAEQVENWSKVITLVWQKIAPVCGVMSRFVPSFFFYFVTGLGEDAFELPVPMW